METIYKLVISISAFSMFLGGLFGFAFCHAYFQQRILISDRKTACEKLGGKYTFMWGDLSNKYYENCEIQSKRINNF